MVIAAIGVVFGDIGTSPLYSMHTVFSIHDGAIAPTEQDVLGVISMVLWCLILIVTVAYIGFIMKAHNQGEGGILSLASLIWHNLGRKSNRAGAAIILAVIGASLFYGDSLITPAISVMSAIEGIEVADPGFAEYIVPISVVILAVLFLAQRWGTGSIGKAFGPIMVTWFVVLILLGVPQIVQNPSIFRAFSPTYAVAFALDRPFIAFVAMGAVVLAVTGVEALYADMGHFGRKPIMLAWCMLVLPALAINYLGQGAMILREPQTIDNPFFHLAPAWAEIPLVVLAACATVIASQAVISGAFSVSRQATRLSLLPRLRVVQTSKDQGGQIYMPTVNILLFLGVLTLVLVFQSSGSLAAAYGLSVTGTLLLELSLFLLLAHAVWGWSIVRVGALAFFVGGLELLLFGANVVKVFSGGWLPLIIAAASITIMLTWRKGSRIMWGTTGRYGRADQRFCGPSPPFPHSPGARRRGVPARQPDHGPFGATQQHGVQPCAARARRDHHHEERRRPARGYRGPDPGLGPRRSARRHRAHPVPRGLQRLPGRSPGAPPRRRQLRRAELRSRGGHLYALGVPHRKGR